MLQHWNSLEDIWERKSLQDIWDNELLTKRPNRLTRSHLAEAIPSFTWWHYLMFYHRDHFFNRPLLETRKKRACWLTSPTKMAIQVITRVTFISINVIPGFWDCEKCGELSQQYSVSCQVSTACHASRDAWAQTSHWIWDQINIYVSKHIPRCLDSNVPLNLRPNDYNNIRVPAN